MPRETRTSGPGSAVSTNSLRSACSTEKGIFRKEGKFWTIAYGGRVFRLKDTKGLAYIAHLLRYPGTEFHVLDLAGGTAGHNDSTADEPNRPTGALPESDEEFARAGIHVGSLGDAGELLDDQAKAAYKQRLAELREQLDEAKELGNLRQAAKAEQEIDALVAELSRAVGLGGRDRRAASPSERARQSVTHAINAAVEKIAENHLALGRLFSRYIRTGTFCSYDPDPNLPLTAWEFGAPVSRSANGSAERGFSGSPSVPPGEIIPVSQFRAANHTPFVGRESEYRQLCNLVDCALTGHGSLGLLAGGPGVGKTRLALEVANYASSRGCRFFIGRCYEREEPHPYLPFAEVIEMALAETSSTDEFRLVLGDNATELAQIAPRLRRAFPDIPPPPELPSPQARRYLFQSLSEFLARVARGVPLFLVLDDLHWADESTLALLNHLANCIAQIPVVIIGTYRDSDLNRNPALARTLEELVRIGLGTIRLQGLAQDAVARMLRGLSLRDPPQALTRLIFEETQGNPFFVEEVYKHLEEEGKVFDASGQFRATLNLDEVEVPRNVRLVLDRRLGRLGEKTRQVLTTAAVIGRSFSFKLLESLLDRIEVDDLLTAIEEAQRMELIVSSSEGPEAPFAFPHELIRQTLLAGVSLPRRQRAHLKVAETIERVHARALNERAAEIAHHLVQAGAAADDKRVVHYLSLAGKSAFEAAAYEEALRYFESVLSHEEVIDPRQRAEMLSNLAMAERGLGRWEEALAHWNESLGIFISLGDHKAIGDICFAIVDGLMWAGTYPAAAEAARRGLAQLEGDISSERALLLARLGVINSGIGAFEPARDALQAALALAERLRDQKLLAMVLGHRSVHHYFFSQLQAAVADGLKTTELLPSEGVPWWMRASRLGMNQLSMYFLGRVEEATRIGEQLEPLARKMGHFAALALCISAQAWAEFGKDPDLTRLEKQLQQAIEFSRSAKLPWSIAEIQAQLNLVEFFRGHWRAGLAVAKAARGPAVVHALEGFVASTLFRHEAYAGDRAGALALLSEKGATLPRINEPNVIGSWAMLLSAIEGLVVLGERERAADLYPLVRQLADTGVVCFTLISRFPQTMAGAAAAAARKWDASEEHFRIALWQSEQFPHRLEQAEIRRFHGGMLVERGEPRDREKARRLLSEALSSYTRIGMPRHSEITKALLDRLQ